MDRQAIIEELKNTIADFLKNKNIVLVDLVYRYEGRDLFLRVLVDRLEGGISLGECAEINRQISMALDEKDIIQERYILEVSSPGLDRPLKTKDDFSRCINRKAHFFFSEPVSGKSELEGIIEKAEDDSVHIKVGTQILETPLSIITKAKQLF